MNKKILSIVFFVVMFMATSVCSAEIVRAVEPFTGAVTYTSKYMFTDDQRNMHSIALVKMFKPLKGVVTSKDKRVQIETYFLLNFTLPQGQGLGDSFDIQVTPVYVNALPLRPNVVSGIGFSTVPTARTGFKELPSMTVAAIEKAKPLLVQVNFSPRGKETYTIPAEIVQEWAKLLKEELEQQPNAKEQVADDKDKNEATITTETKK